MEKLITFLRYTCVPLGISAVYLLLTAFSCSTGTGNGNVDTRPTFQSAYSGKAQDISLGTVQLGYDLTPFINSSIGGQFPMNTVAQLQNSHNINPLLPGYLTISELLSGIYYGTEYPVVRFDFRDPDCSGGAEYVYTFDDGYLCLQKTIKNAPKITKPSCWVEFFAKTVTTTDEVCFKWYSHIPLNIGSSGAVDGMDVISFGDLEYPFGFFASGTKSEDNEVAVRIDGKYAELVENTVIPNRFPERTYGMRPVARQIVFSDVLKQSVCAGGRVKTNYKWLPPEIVELISE